MERSVSCRLMRADMKLNDKAKAIILLGIGIGLLISLYILLPRSPLRFLGVAGRIIMAVGCLMWSIPELTRGRMR